MISSFSSLIFKYVVVVAWKLAVILHFYKVTDSKKTVGFLYVVSFISSRIFDKTEQTSKPEEYSRQSSQWKLHAGDNSSVSLLSAPFFLCSLLYSMLRARNQENHDQRLEDEDM